MAIDRAASQGVYFRRDETRYIIVLSFAVIQPAP